MVLVFLPTFSSSPSLMMIESFGIMQVLDPTFLFEGVQVATPAFMLPDLPLNHLVSDYIWIELL
jgi:hypothetical protein